VGAGCERSGDEVPPARRARWWRPPPAVVRQMNKKEIHLVGGLSGGGR
jgi:hypothetical protein